MVIAIRRFMSSAKVTITKLKKMYDCGEKIAALTAYDYPTGRLVDKAGIPMCLVGDSLGMVCLGYPNTQKVTLSDMIHHSRAVSKGVKSAFLVVDMPFGSYRASCVQAVENAVRLVQEGSAEAVKLEGGAEISEHVKSIVRAGIPVFGHIGLTPQSHTALGGFRPQARTAVEALNLLKDAQTLQDAGCDALIIEAVPSVIAEELTKRLSIPTIGIGSGNKTSGQVLVMADMLGLFDQFLPKFSKQYLNLNNIIGEALKQYCQEVASQQFPNDQHCYAIKEEELQKFLTALKANILGS